MTKKIDANGFWHIEDNPISKEGIYPYYGRQISPTLEPDKIYKVFRPREELRKAAETFKNVPILNDHTMVGKDFTPMDDLKEHGVLGERVYEKDGTLYSNIVVRTDELKNLIQNGKKELSMGYQCTYDLTPGIWKGQKYDAVQRDLVGNHVALVQNGRMGHDVRVMDSKDAIYACDSFDIKGAEEMNTEDFDESKHKRDESGKFSSTGGGASKKGGEKSSAEKTSKSTEPSYLDKMYDYKKEYNSLRDKLEEKGLSNEYSNWRLNYGSEKDKEYYAQKAKADKIREKKDYTPENEKFLTQHSYLGMERNIEAMKKFLSTKSNGASGKDAAPEKEQKEMDKREAIREIMAISAKPVSEFAGGEEEKVETISKLAEKLAYNPSEAGTNDEGGKVESDENTDAKDACGKDADSEDKRKLIDEIGGILKGKVDEEVWRTIIGKAEKLAYEDSEASADDEDVKKEDKKALSMDEMEKELLKRISAKNTLAEKLKPFIGAFDHNDMTIKDMAVYACEKLGKKVAQDEAVTFINGYLEAAQKPSANVVMDEAPAFDKSEDAAFEAFLKGE